MAPSDASVSPLDWAKQFYTTRSEWFGPTGIFPEHQARALDLERWCGSSPKRVLDLGAGAGGTAAAIADRGHTVVAVEFSPVRATFARSLARTRPNSMTVVEADFYTVDLEGRFDVVCYWDGFGVGSDIDQRRLLQRVARDWLNETGAMVLDVFSPPFWTARAGHVERTTEVRRLVNDKVRTVRLEIPIMARYDFDHVMCRYLSEWWPSRQRREVIRESIRCYSPVDFLLLAEGTGLKTDGFEVNGHRFDPRASDRIKALSQNPSYRVRLIGAAERTPGSR